MYCKFKVEIKVSRVLYKHNYKPRPLLARSGGHRRVARRPPDWRGPVREDWSSEWDGMSGWSQVLEPPVSRWAGHWTSHSTPHSHHGTVAAHIKSTVHSTTDTQISILLLGDYVEGGGGLFPVEMSFMSRPPLYFFLSRSFFLNLFWKNFHTKHVY